ncbi:hypothetical protein M8C21_008216 [Ambrosia artemisiifolia]|uniref:glutathione transferase n=1 Tax=Ambrosia artemisiifolia TaxID=4212 RepID=A0AAD5GTP2_AMBAR|nr:hypothetical protein M8C21_008216 [Ambrosia artemisiifolia]
MAIVGVWMEVESQKFEQLGSKLAWELAYKPMFGMTADEAIVEENEKKLGQGLFDARPHVSAWAAEIMSRPAWVKVGST